MDDFQTWEAYAMPGQPLVVRLGDYELELYHNGSGNLVGATLTVDCGCGQGRDEWTELARGGEIPSGR